MMTMAEQDPESANLPERQLQWMKMQALAFADRKSEVLTLCRRSIEVLAAPAQTRDRWSSELDLAMIHAWFGDHKECVEILKRLLLVPSGITVPNLRLAPDWDRVRDDPAFQALLADPETPRRCRFGATGSRRPNPGLVSRVRTADFKPTMLAIRIHETGGPESSAPTTFPFPLARRR